MVDHGQEVQSGPEGEQVVGVEAPARSSDVSGAAGDRPKMKTKEYEKQMRRLHGELVALQEWVKATGAKVCIVFEGRDTAGKGGTIKRITERVSPRVFRIVALPAPDRAGEVADVHPALHPALPGRRRGDHLRPQLVQPRRRRAGDGLLHARAVANGSWSRSRRSRRRWSTPASS